MTLVVNNAGISTGTKRLGDLDKIRLELDTHYFGTLSVVRAFAPGRHPGGGGILNVISALSWFSYDGSDVYAAAKTAGCSVTNGIRIELAPQAGLSRAVVEVGGGADQGEVGTAWGKPSWSPGSPTCSRRDRGGWRR